MGSEMCIRDSLDSCRIPTMGVHRGAVVCRTGGRSSVTVSGAVLNSARWRRLVPIAFITYSFAYLDRSNYSIGAAGGLTDALHIAST